MLYSTPFNFFIYNLLLPPPTHNIFILSYADNLTITSLHSKIPQAPKNLQQYLMLLEHCLLDNQMTASPLKPSVTLLTPDKHISNIHPHIKLFNQTLPPNKRLTGQVSHMIHTWNFHFNENNTKTKWSQNPYEKKIWPALLILYNSSYGQLYTMPPLLIHLSHPKVTH